MNSNKHRPEGSLTVIVARRDRFVRLPLLAFAEHSNPQVLRTLAVGRKEIHLSRKERFCKAFVGARSPTSNALS